MFNPAEIYILMFSYEQHQINKTLQASPWCLLCWALLASRDKRSAPDSESAPSWLAILRKTLALELLLLHKNQPENEKSATPSRQLMSDLDFRSSSVLLVSPSSQGLTARQNQASWFVKFQAVLYEIYFNH